MVIGHFDGNSPLRDAQGPKSKALHFNKNAPLCVDCNGALTQAADRAFDRFHSAALSCVSQSAHPQDAFNIPEFAMQSRTYLDLFRYFAKLLACHIAEDCGPRFTSLTQFARGDVDDNIILLDISIDPDYKEISEEFGELPFAADGGLMAHLHKSRRWVTGFQSSITFGPIRYTFWIKFGWAIGLYIRFAHREFWQLCLNASRQLPESRPAADQ